MSKTDIYEAFLSLNTKQEAQSFLRDLCTVAEIKAMTERWQVAQKVNQGIPYRKIAEETGVSTATITRVAQWLHHGQGGYKLALHRLL